MIQKRILVPSRLRRPPATGWSWLDRRFVRENMAHLSREAALLYFFLSAVADRHGLSFYSDGTLAALLRMTLPALIQAREELLAHDLIAHEVRWTQVPLYRRQVEQPRRPEPGQGLVQLGELMRQMAERPLTPREGARHECRFQGRNPSPRRDREVLRLGHFSTTTLLLATYSGRGTAAGSTPCGQSAAHALKPLGLAPSQDRRLGGQVPRTRGGACICEEIARGPDGYGGSRRGKCGPPLPAEGPARARACLPGSPIRAGPGDAG